MSKIVYKGVERKKLNRPIYKCTTVGNPCSNTNSVLLLQNINRYKLDMHFFRSLKKKKTGKGYFRLSSSDGKHKIFRFQRAPIGDSFKHRWRFDRSSDFLFFTSTVLRLNKTKTMANKLCLD